MIDSFPRSPKMPPLPPIGKVDIKPSKTRGNHSWQDLNSWVMDGHTLRHALSEILNVPQTFIDLPSSISLDKIYSFALALPEGSSQEELRDQLLRGIESHFHLTSQREQRLTGVYVLATAPEPHPHLEPVPYSAAGVGVATGKEMKMPFLAILLLLLRIPIHKFPFLQRKLFSRSIVLQRFSPETLGSLGMSGTTADLCRFLQHTLDRPVIDEALLDGPFDFHVPADETRSFSDRLRDHCGLTLTAEQRTIEMVVFRPT